MASIFFNRKIRSSKYRNNFWILRSNIKKGKGVRFNTLVQLAKPIERLPLLLKDKDTNNLVKLNYHWIEYKKNLPDNYIGNSFKLFRQNKDLKSTKVASLSGVSYLTYSNLEKRNFKKLIGMSLNKAQERSKKLA